MNDKINPGWWRQAPSQIKILLGAMGAFLTIFVTVSTAWPTLEPMMYAHRGYVREYVSDENSKLRKELGTTRSGVFDIQLSIARTRRSAINDRILSVEIEAANKSITPEELVKRRTQIERLREEREEVDADIKSILLRRDRD